MYVCMYVCTYVCMYVRVHIYVCTHTHTHTHTHTYIYIYICLCVCGESFPEEIFLNSVQSMCLSTTSTTYSPFSVSSTLYRVYLKLDEIQESVSHNKIRKKIHISRLYVRKQFSKYSPTTCWFQNFRFLYVETIKPPPPSGFIYNWTRRDNSPTQFLCLSKQSQLPRDLWKGATVRDQTGLSVYWFRWKIFEGFHVELFLDKQQEISSY